MLLHEKFSLVGGPSIRPDVYPQPVAGTAIRRVCMVVVLSLRGSGVALEWCWMLLGLLSQYQACGTILDGLQPRAYWQDM